MSDPTSGDVSTMTLTPLSTALSTPSSTPRSTDFHPRPRTGVRQDCRHPRARHEHGTEAAYQYDACRCSDCQHAHRAALRRQARARRSEFRASTTPAGPVRDHLRKLRDAGLSIRQIGDLAGLPGSTIRDVIYGSYHSATLSERLKTETAERILGVHPPSAPAARTVDATSTREQLDALIAAGHSLHELAAALGRTTSNLRRTMLRGSVSRRTAEDVAKLHRRLLRARAARIRRAGTHDPDSALPDPPSRSPRS